MTELNLRPVAAPKQTSKSKQKPTPTSSVLNPWQFEYASSPDGTDLNLLIMFHGLGDTKAAFSGLGRQLNLPSTAVLSLQAPDQIPLLETPAWSWYNTFDPMFEPLPSPNPSKHIPALRNLLTTLTSPEISWDLTQIHLFGWGQGATMALELALDIGKNPLPAPAGDGVARKRLGSVVAVCGGLLSFPTGSLELETPVCFFTRSDQRGQVGQKEVASVKRGFKKVEIVQGKGGGGGLAMPRGKEEWIGIMRFWGQVLGREEGWKGDGEVYEVVR